MARISPDELLGRTEAGDSTTVVDVRSGLEFRDGHIPGAVHVPFWKLPFAAGEIPADREEPLVVTCGHGPRAGYAILALKVAGFRDVRYLSGQMSGWKRRGLPEESD